MTDPGDASRELIPADDVESGADSGSPRGQESRSQSAADSQLLPAGDPGGQSMRHRFEPVFVDGDAGRRLGVLQAQAIMEVLTWLYEQQTGQQG